jgi:hypothetical protein
LLTSTKVLVIDVCWRTFSAPGVRPGSRQRSQTTKQTTILLVIKQRNAETLLTHVYAKAMFDECFKVLLTFHQDSCCFVWRTFSVPGVLPGDSPEGPPDSRRIQRHCNPGPGFRRAPALAELCVLQKRERCFVNHSAPASATCTCSHGSMRRGELP